MAYRTISDLGSFGATGMIDIIGSCLAVDQVNDGNGGVQLVVDLSGMTDVIPERAVPAVVVKDNFLNARSAYPLGRESWGKGEERRFAVDLPQPLHPSKTEITVIFTEPGDSRLIAASGSLRLKDEALDWSGGESFFQTRLDRSCRRPVTALMEREGPIFVLGAMGPKSSWHAGEDFHFLSGHVIAGIEKFATHLLLSEPGHWVGKYWDALRQRIADARGFSSWDEVLQEYRRNDDLEECARDCAGAFFTNKTFYADLKKHFEAQVERQAGEQEQGQ